jgi:hypothetical protein
VEAPPVTSHLYGQLPWRAVSSLFLVECEDWLTVVITADTAVSAKGLSVLAPEAVGGLGVDEAIWVGDGCNVEVKLVDEGSDVRV